jgi:hypothetical protein
MSGWKTWVAAIGAIGLAGCSATKGQTQQDVLLTLRADTQSVLIAGCAGLPVADVLLETILEFVPEGTDKDKVVHGLTLAGAKAQALCAKLAPPPSIHTQETP